MRFEDAATRLSVLPERLPAPPPRLVPVLIAPGADVGSLPPIPPGPRRHAAVLVLIHPDAAGNAMVVLTERSGGGQRHAGQVSFPGGAVEPGDESVVAAALREAREEVSLDLEQAGVWVVGAIRPIEVRVSGFLAHPVIALAQREPLMRPDPREVAHVFSAPLSAFLPGAPIEMVTSQLDGRSLRYGAYRVAGHVVWGATATMLGGLGRYLASAGEHG